MSKSPWLGPREFELHRETSPLACPTCGKINDMVTSVDFQASKAPEEGDIIICINCANPAEFAGQPPSLQKLEGDKLILVLADPKVKKAQQALIQISRGKNVPPRG